MTRKLASIQIISDIKKHSNADRLKLATILGWQVIVTDMEKGDKVIYCEIDSMLPADSQWIPDSFKGTKINNKYRIKTIKLRGELSQGYIISLTSPGLEKFANYEIGSDVTEELGIEKYDDTVNNPGWIDVQKNHGMKPFPTNYVEKTDEARIQSEPYLLENICGKPYYTTVKLDGMSITILTLDGQVKICSRNYILNDPDPKKPCPYNTVCDKYDLKNKLLDYPDLVIQGEVCGPKIQNNLLKLPDIDMYVFNMVEKGTYKKYSREKMIEMCKKLGLKHVPIIDHGDSFPKMSVNQVLELSKGFYDGTKNHREGLVIRSEDQTLSFKAINNDYLLR